MNLVDTQVTGAELQPGDVIEVWWFPRRDTILKLTPYTGPLADVFKKGAQIAVFAQNVNGMTIDNAALYRVLNRRRG